MKIIISLILTLSIQLSFAQDLYFVNAENGLFCRAAPDKDSEKIGKLPFGSVVELISITNSKSKIIDQDKVEEGQWVKIKYTNFPYVVSTKDNISFEQEAYVFDGYLESLNKATITTEVIDALQFNAYQQNSSKNKLRTKKITDFAIIKKMLMGKATWSEHEENNEQLILKTLLLNNGHKLTINLASNDYSVSSYYPEEQILVLEGGHSSDYAISIKTGESLATVGNPEYIIASPHNKTRLNGYFPGQECSAYFFQKFIDKAWIYLTDFGWDSPFGSDVCNFEAFIWINDTQFVYTYLDHSTNSEAGNLFYKKATLVEH